MLLTECEKICKILSGARIGPELPCFVRHSASSRVCLRLTSVVPTHLSSTESASSFTQVLDDTKGTLTHSFSQSACDLALLTGAALFAAPAAQAQHLVLGQSGTTLAATATLTGTGTTASGTYTYDDGGTGVTFADQNAYTTWMTYGSSMADISGGSINSILARNTSTINISGGSVGNVFSNDFSTVSVSSGNIFNIQTVGFHASTVNISGGNIVQLVADSAGTINVSGGNIRSLQAYNGNLDLFGMGFTETLLGIPFDQHYSVTGTLQNGDPLNAVYYDVGGTLEFNGVPAVPVNPVPEASSFVSLGLLLLLGMGGVAVSRRHRADAAG